MRMSCNGCRVLRKGCSEDCSIRPCLQWIKNPESQSNATVFLAKFYGRAGLLNLINAGPDHLRPAIFRSLLYEGCGRIVNPVYGSVGLLWSGNWPLCQAAVEAVLMGAPITQMTPDAAESASMSPIKSLDIRHVAKDFGSNGLHQRSKRPCPAAQEDAADYKRQRTENESSASHQSKRTCSGGAASSSHESEDTADGSMVTSHDGSDVELDLTLGFAGVAPTPATRTPTKRCDVSSMSEGDDTCTVNLTLDLAS